METKTTNTSPKRFQWGKKKKKKKKKKKGFKEKDTDDLSDIKSTSTPSPCLQRVTYFNKRAESGGEKKKKQKKQKKTQTNR